ncbi:hypothetical protein AB1Y20_003238 [Prymnesium parvum]|uniref:peptide-methionine (R)-S-oxide reductase n=1 Tax=Prymnesium parvum TaxID=97485 RepID=A0AB34JD51_PRYPA
MWLAALSSAFAPFPSQLPSSPSLLLVAPSPSFTAATPPASSRGAPRMEDKRKDAEAALARMQQRMRSYSREARPRPLALDPRAYTLGYSAIIAVTLHDLRDNAEVQAWLSAGAAADAIPLGALSGGAVLIAFALFQLAFQLGTGSAVPFRLAVMRLGLTEPPFSSPLNDETREGSYLCSSCGAKLFDSAAKYDSGSGWPSFWRTYDGGVVYRKELLGGKMEVRCQACDGHLGHVFSDGPSIQPGEEVPPSDPGGANASFTLNDDTVHPRFCINGCALKFEEQV